MEHSGASLWTGWLWYFLLVCITNCFPHGWRSSHHLTGRVCPEGQIWFPLLCMLSVHRRWSSNGSDTVWGQEPPETVTGRQKGQDLISRPRKVNLNTRPFTQADSNQPVRYESLATIDNIQLLSVAVSLSNRWPYISWSVPALCVL